MYNYTAAIHNKSISKVKFVKSISKAIWNHTDFAKSSFSYQEENFPPATDMYRDMECLGLPAD